MSVHHFLLLAAVCSVSFILPLEITPSFLYVLQCMSVATYAFHCIQYLAPQLVLELFWLDQYKTEMILLTLPGSLF